MPSVARGRLFAFDRAGDKAALPDVRAVTELQLKRLDAKLAATTGGLVPDRALREQARREIAAYFDGDDDPAGRSRFRVIPFPWP